MASKKVRVQGLWEPQGILQKMGHYTMDPFELGDTKGKNAAEKAANIARFMFMQRMFGGLGNIGRAVFNKRMGKLLSPEKAQKKAAKFGPDNPEDYDFDPASGLYYVKNEAWPEGDNPNWEGPFDPTQEPLSGQMSEDPMFGQDAGKSFLEFDPNAPEPFIDERTYSSGGDDYGALHDEAFQIPPAPGMKQGPQQDSMAAAMNRLNSPLEKAEAFDYLRNPFESPELAAAFAPGADISIDRPFDPRPGMGGFGAGDTLSRMGYGGGGTWGGDVFSGMNYLY